MAVQGIIFKFLVTLLFIKGIVHGYGKGKRLVGSGSLNLGSVGNAGLSVQNGQVSATGNINLPGGSSVNANLQNGTLSGSANVALPGGSNVNVGVNQNGQVSGSANLQLPGGSSVNANLKNGQVSGSGTLQLPGGSSINANLQNGQISGGGNINLGNGGQASVNVQNGQLSAGLKQPGGSSGGSAMGGGGSSFQPGNMGGSFNFKPGQMTGGSGMSGNSGSGSGTGFNMGSGGGSNGFNIGSGFNTGSGSGSGSGSGGFNMGSGSGSGSGGFNMGSGSGSGSGSGGFNMGSGSGSGSGSGGFNMGSGSGSGSGSGGFNMGSGSGGFNMGSGVSSGSSSGSGTGGLNMGSGSGSLGSASGSGSGNTGMGSVTNSGGSAVGTTAVKSGATQAGISGQNPPSGSCLCLTGTNVVVHANGGINAQKLGSISQPKCVTYTGSKITPCLHDATTNDKRAWFKISLNGQVGWIAGDYLAVADRSRCSSGSSSSTGGSSSSSGVSGTSTPGGSGNQQQASSGTLSNCFPGAEMNALEQKLLQYESLRTTAYDAQPKSSYKDWTVCVGFNLKRGNARNVFAKALPGVNFDAVYNGQALTREQCMKLFAYDLDANYVSQPKGRFGASFCQLPRNVKIAIVNAYYRGDMGPKTQSLIANGDWCHVKAEYLNHGDYINCVSKGIPGVCTRMDWNADQFQSMCSGKTSNSSSSHGGSSPIQNSGSGSCDPVAKEYACKLLQLYNTGKLSLWDAHASKEHDSAFCINNIRDTCNGGKAQRSSYTCSECPSGAPGGSVCLNPNLLKYVYNLGSRGTEKVLVNEFAGACHHCGSWHYEGKAVDLQTSSRNQDYMDTCRRFGGAPLDEHSHIHCTIKN
ncbi:unnamed protein product [Mytilus coruscus]|uniref:SH3b domain-containing protein n=1 Tax=Mytilus coruscus TaxID=42192 RepID=A0A6J8E886_MYTCO|nr:unnamed protein product [Mytilus coruscus]